jgi:hypothetical protein
LIVMGSAFSVGSSSLVTVTAGNGAQTAQVVQVVPA